MHGKCMINKAVNGIKSCQECDDFTVKVEDGKVIACRAKTSETGGILFDEYSLSPTVPGKRFNASIIERGDGFALAYRTGWKGSNIHVADLWADFKPTGADRKIELVHSLAP